MYFATKELSREGTCKQVNKSHLPHGMHVQKVVDGLENIGTMSGIVVGVAMVLVSLLHPREKCV